MRETINHDDSEDSNLLNSSTSTSTKNSNLNHNQINKNQPETGGPIRFSVNFDKINPKKNNETIYNNESFDYFCKNQIEKEKNKIINK